LRGRLEREFSKKPRKADEYRIFRQNKVFEPKSSETPAVIALWGKIKFLQGISSKKRRNARGYRDVD
jgi:hypothetical protein